MAGVAAGNVANGAKSGKPGERPDFRHGIPRLHNCNSRYAQLCVDLIRRNLTTTRKVSPSPPANRMAQNGATAACHRCGMRIQGPGRSPMIITPSRSTHA